MAALAELPADDIASDYREVRSDRAALRCTIAYERADWDNVRLMEWLLLIRAKYMTAIGWACKLNGTLLN
jgi:hypothetical protein